jgi:hypothetical protein
LRSGRCPLVFAAGLRWPVEEAFEFGKGCFGLDQSQVRLYAAVARHNVLVMAALAVCAVTAALLRGSTGTQAPPPGRSGQARSRWHHQRARCARDTAIPWSYSDRRLSYQTPRRRLGVLRDLARGSPWRVTEQPRDGAPETPPGSSPRHCSRATRAGELVTRPKGDGFAS